MVLSFEDSVESHLYHFKYKNNVQCNNSTTHIAFSMRKALQQFENAILELSFFKYLFEFIYLFLKIQLESYLSIYVYSA